MPGTIAVSHTCSYSLRYTEKAKFDLARHSWKEALVSGKRSADTNWPNEIMGALLDIARSGRFVFICQLIAESDLEEQLFPLARAIDYLQTIDLQKKFRVPLRSQSPERITVARHQGHDLMWCVGKVEQRFVHLGLQAGKFREVFQMRGHLLHFLP
jgi:hypothetical protein